jgi:hypothetical protein
MRTLRTLAVVAVGLLVVAAFSNADDAAKKGKKKAHGVHGVVTEIKKDGDKDSGTITVTVHGKKGKNGAAATEAVTKTYKITTETTFETVKHKKSEVKGQKGEVETTTVKFADLKEKAHVVLVLKEGSDDTVASVKINLHDGKKKKAESK